MMLIQNQMIEVKWALNNCTYYKEKGYNFTKIGDTFLVKAEDLMRGSSSRVNVACDGDSCNVICNTSYKSYINSLELHPNQYFCKSCIQKQKSTRNKVEQILLERYGDTNIFKTQYFKDKSKQTNLDKLGVEYPMQSQLVQEKSKQTVYSKGDLYGFQNKDRREKAQKTLSESGQVAISTQQKELFEILSSGYNCKLNKSLSGLTLDIEVVSKNNKIDIEIDGDYWHRDAQKDRKRDEVVKSYGYKVMRIRISHKLPDTQKILEGIDNLLSSDHTFYQIIAEDCKYNYNNN